MYGKRNTRDSKRAFLIKNVADKHGVKTRTVERYIEGVRENDEVLSDYDDLRRAVDQVIEAYQKNNLMHAVKQLVPF